MHNFTSIKNYHREMAKHGDFLDELIKKTDPTSLSKRNMPWKCWVGMKLL